MTDMQDPDLQKVNKKRLVGLPFNRMIPNILTLLALCAGMTAMRYSLQGQWEKAVFAILVAAVLDGLDGRIARLLKGATKFGAELDSLSDFISFGVAPAFMLYLWSMQEAGRFGWILVLLYGVCCALRLARFNTMLEEHTLPSWAYNFFSGTPAPASAGLVLLPMIISFQIGDDIFRRVEVVSFFLISVSALMVSRIPTYSFKKFHIRPEWILPTMLVVGLLAALTVSAPWLMLSVILVLYLASIPLSIRSFQVLRKRAGERPARPSA